MPTARWNHVPSKHNPADCASRDLFATELISHDLWWSGPSWLHQSSTSWPIRDHAPTFDKLQEEQLFEIRKSTIHHVTRTQEWELPFKFSSWTRLVRVTVYIYRFVRNLKQRKISKARVVLSIEELRDAANFWLQSVQRLYFAAELHALMKESSLSRSSPLCTLNPFLGDDNLLRLGGRLKHSAVSYSEQHPIILPKHRVAELLIELAHKATLHGGTQLTLRALRQCYWILEARSLVKTHIRQCVTCTRYAAIAPTQLMGDLPSPRVNPSPPFSHTRVDYA